MALASITVNVDVTTFVGNVTTSTTATTSTTTTTSTTVTTTTTTVQLFFREMTVFNNNDTHSFLESQPVNFTLDTATLLTEGKIQADCSDVVIEFNQEFQLQWINTTECNTTSTNFYFDMRGVNISANGNSTLFRVSYNNTSPNITNPSTMTQVFSVENDTLGITALWYFNQDSGTVAPDDSIFGEQDNPLSITNNNWTEGRFDQGQGFDGTRDTVADASSASDLNLGGGDFTVGGYYFKDGCTASQSIQKLFGKHDGTKPRWQIDASTCNNNFSRFHYEPSSEDFINGPLINTSSWHQIAFTFDGSDIIPFLDGTFRTPQSVSTGALGNSDLFEVGIIASQPSPIGALEGRIDDLFIIKRAITNPSELHNLRPIPSTELGVEMNMSV